MADRLTLPQAGAVGAALLANAVAGYGLIVLDERMGMAHLTAGEISALRRPAPATAQPSPTTAGPSTASDSTSTSVAPSGSAHDKLIRADKTLPNAGPNGGPNEAPDEGDAASNVNNATGFNRIAPPAYLATVSTPSPASASPTDRRFVIKRILPIDGPIRYGEWHWDEAGVPPGPLVITVDLQARVISVFRNGYEIGTAAVLLGTGEYPTPLGMFPISQKDAHHISNIYDAPMPWMLRLTSDGVTIHGSNVRNGYASHGCIGVPMDFAKKLYGEARLGDRVYITRGKQVGLGDSLVDQ